MNNVSSGNTLNFKGKLKFKQQMIAFNILYMISFVSLLDIVFGSSGWLSDELPMINIQHAIYSPSLTTIFCALGLISMAVALTNSKFQGQLMPFVSTRKVIIQIDVVLLAIYSFYFTLLALLLPYLNITLHLILKNEPFIKGYTLFADPSRALLNAWGIFLVLYLIALVFYFVGLCWRKHKSILLISFVSVLIIWNITKMNDILAPQLAKLPWSSFLFFSSVSIVAIACMLVVNYFVQRKWEVQ